MKPRNFPARKLKRQMMAEGGLKLIFSPEGQARLEAARNIRTKICRISK